MYTVNFFDGTTFEGGNPSDSKWDEIPKKAITSIEYSLTPFITYRFADFDAYNHCVERVKGVNNSLNTITKVVIMGAVKNRVYQIVLDATGSVFQTTVAAGEEYSTQTKLDANGRFAGWINPKPLTSGWKSGAKRPAGVEPRLEKMVNEGLTTVENQTN